LTVVEVTDFEVWHEPQTAMDRVRAAYTELAIQRTQKRVQAVASSSKASN
jgi:hypothetical protein